MMTTSKCVGIEMAQVTGVEALDRREDVLELRRTFAADPLLAECVVPQRVAEGGPALVQDLLAVGHEEKPSAGQRRDSRA